jgi:CRP/FNR family cyclic AMP-dependent transcriptional regulator
MTMMEKPVVSAFIAKAITRSYPNRHTIIHTGDEPQTLFLLLDGSVSILLEDEDGREIVLDYLSAGDFFGEMCLFPEQKVRTAIVRTRSAAVVAEMDFQDFRQFSHAHPEIMFEVAGQLAGRLSDTSRRLGDLAFLDVAGRLAHVLLDLCDDPDARPHPRGTVVRISRQELARNVGCSREMAGRVLKKLAEDGVITTQGRNILIFRSKKN